MYKFKGRKFYSVKTLYAFKAYFYKDKYFKCKNKTLKKRYKTLAITNYKKGM